jgi:ubiquinone/menaquinone biosynthesis C-methylase UbiE
LQHFKDAQRIATMPKKTPRKAEGFIKEKVRDSVKYRYFPELWYLIDNFFSTVRNKHLLEIGYGMGLIGEAFGKTGWRLTCLDQSISSLASLKERLSQANVHATFEQSDLLKFPLASHSFDAAICINTLEFQTRPSDTLREISRVLRPGGRAAIVAFNKFSPWGVEAVARNVRDVGRSESQYRAFAKYEFVKMLKMAGFSIISVKERACYLPGSKNPNGITLPLTGAFVGLVTKPAANGQPAPLA